MTATQSTSDAQTMILHHYENSPYAEKIRLMFGLTGSSWGSLISPAWPPRPNVDPLSGGYRRIPIAQLGADIFCDSSLIARELAHRAGQPALDPANVSGAARELMHRAEGAGFFSAITAVPPLKLLGTMLGSFGPRGAYRFVKDRSGLLKGGSARPPSAENARTVMRELFSSADQLLAEQAWLGGEQASVADFALYHPLWLHLQCGGRLPDDATHLKAWYDKVSAIGHGTRIDITQADAFAAARDADPRPLPGNASRDDERTGREVRVAPEDYGLVPVSGRACEGDRAVRHAACALSS